MSRPLHVEIDSNAFLHNLKIAKKFAPYSSLLAMVKANAYGHGIEALLPTFSQIETLGVACLEEAIELRNSGYHQKIVILEGFFQTDDLDLISRLDLQIVLHHFDQLSTLHKVKLKNPLTVWVKLNTGMNRLGFAVEDIQQIFQQLEINDKVKKPIHWMSHFSESDNLNSGYTEQQTNLFLQCCKSFSGLKSLANSAAILSRPETHLDVVRPGIMLYGVSPFPNKTAEEFALRPVMTLRSELIAINQAKKGEAIGYGRTWICPEDMLYGVVAVGYGDGYPRHIKNGTPILVNDKLTQVVGRVSMDMITVDLRPCNEARVGDQVILWGKGLPVEKIAAAAETIPYEILCHINPKSLRKQIVAKTT